MKTSNLVSTLLIASFALFTSACSGCEATEENNTTENNTECTAGEVGCACLADSTCNGTAVCNSGMCEGATVSGLVVQASGARACEILLTESGATFLGATYGDGVQGAFRRQAPRVALALSASGDADFPASVASLQLDGASDAVSIASVKCWGADQAVIDGASATLQ